MQTMGLWDNIKSSAARMNDELKTSISKYKNSDFANASMAMCALVAAADGTIDDSQRSKTAGFIASNDSLSAFDPADLQSRFNGFCDKLSEDFDFGKISVLQTIGKVRNKPEAARAVIQVGIVIGGADGSFDPVEKKMVQEACNALQLNADEFELSAENRSPTPHPPKQEPASKPCTFCQGKGCNFCGGSGKA
jgi:tellurite resistance protein TerB